MFNYLWKNFNFVRFLLYWYAYSRDGNKSAFKDAMFVHGYSKKSFKEYYDL